MKDGHHTWPYSGEEHPVWMKHEEEPLDDYNKRMKEYITDLVKQEIVGLGEEKKRDYKEERQIDTKELLNAFEKEKQELAASYRQSLANKKERENKWPKKNTKRI